MLGSGHGALFVCTYHCPRLLTGAHAHNMHLPTCLHRRKLGRVVKAGFVMLPAAAAAIPAAVWPNRCQAVTAVVDHLARGRLASTTRASCGGCAACCCQGSGGSSGRCRRVQWLVTKGPGGSEACINKGVGPLWL